MSSLCHPAANSTSTLESTYWISISEVVATNAQDYYVRVVDNTVLLVYIAKHFIFP